MALPPLQQLGFGTSPHGSKETLHQACAQAEGGSSIFLPHKNPLRRTKWETCRGRV
jgi:hypothetical protein